MAIYSLNLGFISRSEGRSAVGFSAYISGGKAQDVRTGVGYDYGCKDAVIVSRVLAPIGAPEWVKSSSILWNKVEQFEDEIANLRFRGDARDPDKNQKSLEAKEKFLSSTQTAQTIMGALPIEFSRQEAELCVEEFLSSRFVSRGLVVEYAIHWDRGNPHFHGLITRRPLVEGEFSQRKDPDIVRKSELMITRKQWEEVANKYLELGGHEVRIDSRSHADRGLLFLPTEHEGWYAQRRAERGEYSRIVTGNDAIRQRNIEILCNNPETLIQELAQKRTVFTRAHLEDEILRRVGGDEKLFSLLKAKVENFEIPQEMILNQANDNFMGERVFGQHLQQVVSSFADRLLGDSGITHFVGENVNRDKVFTSVSYKQQEEKLLVLADSLSQRQSKAVSQEAIGKSIDAREAELGFELSDEQRSAITHLCSGSDICILNGKAGTGKTTLLKAVSDAYQESGYRVLGTSFQGKAVEIMEQEIGIPCKTLDSFQHAWKTHQQQSHLLESGKLWGRPYEYAVSRIKELEQHKFTDKDVIIVDEANMIGGHLWEPFLEEATSKGAKVLIVQDPAQIKSRDPGDYGRLFGERYSFCETSEVVRQRTPWQRECSKLLNDHHVLDGLKPYYDHGHFTWHDRAELAIQSLTQDYVKDYLANPDQTRIALAYRNAEVYELNQSIRSALIEKGYLGRAGQQNSSPQEDYPQGDYPQGDYPQEFTIHGENYAIGDRIRFTQNDHHGTYVKNVSSREGEDSEGMNHRIGKGVKNGTFGTIEAYGEKRFLLTVCLDGNRRVQFNIDEYAHITHGYAMGTHKSEGSTFDRSFVSLDPLLDPSTLLVAMTRHRENASVYVNQEQFADFKDVVDRIGRPSQKQTLQDYTVLEDQKPYFEQVQQYRDLMIEGATLREEMESSPRWDSGAGLEPPMPLYKHASYAAYQTCFEEKKRISENILKDWNNHAPYVKLAGIRKDVLEVEAGFRPRLLSDLEHRASIQVQGYMDLVRETRDLWKTIGQTHPGTLASSHKLYESYKAKKTERDSLASVFQENTRLYSPFFKVTKDEMGNMKDYWGEDVTKETRVYQASIKLHAEAHRRSQAQRIFYERLNQDQKAYYDEVKAYVNARNEAAAIYGYLRKEAETPKEDSAHMSPSFQNSRTFEQFRGSQAKRDQLALKLVESPAHYQPFFNILKVKEDKLLDHAVAGEIREKVEAYAFEADHATRAIQAQELKRILTTPKDYRIFKETGLETNRLSFDIAFYEKIKSGEIPSALSYEQLYKPIQSYLNAEKDAACLLKLMKTKEKEALVSRGEASQELPELPSKGQDAHKKDWQAAILVRNEQARIIANNKEAMTVIGTMGQGIQDRLLRQAGIATPDPSNKPQHITPSVAQILEASRGHAASLATELLGAPNVHLSNKTTLRFGTKGSLVVNLSGPKAGLWKDFESGEGGNIFHLIQREKGLNFKESISYLANSLNLSTFKVPSLKLDTLNVNILNNRPINEIPVKAQLNEPTKSTALQPSATSQQSTPEDIKDRASRLNAVSELHMKAKPLEGTVAETYLRQIRGITGALAPDLRYLPKGTTFMYKGERHSLAHHCFAAFGRTIDERLSSVQLTKLDDQGNRAIGSDGQKFNKLQYGIAKGSFVCLQDGKASSQVFIAEGVETALSLKDAGVDGKIVASMGINNMANYQGSERRIILCADNDEHKENSQTHTMIKNLREHFILQGKNASIIKPNTPGEDFNDVLRKQGRQGVQAYVGPYLNPDAEKEAQASGIINAGRLEAQKITETQKLTQTAIAPSSSTNRVNNIEIISRYIEAKIREVKAYEGTSLGREVKEEFRSYLETFQKDERMLQEFKSQYPDLVKDIQQLYPKQQRIHEQTRQKSYDMDM
jgi:ATP-dependent exoDNAse (exonuclease V) alpha subunit